MDYGWAVLDEGAPFGALARAFAMPCCTFVALWLLAVQGRVAVDREGTPSERYRAAVAAGSSVDPPWWRAANVDEARPRPWSTLDAAGAAVGSTQEVPRLVGSLAAPALTLGRWHVIQRWRDAARLQGGHTYLVYADASGRTVRVVQSSVEKGFRVSRGSWDSTAGLAGYHVGAVVMPSLEVA